MHRATVRIEIGKGAKDYLSLLDKRPDSKRGRVRVSEKGGVILIEAEASDAAALISSLGSSIKQLRVVSSVDLPIARLK